MLTATAARSIFMAASLALNAGISVCIMNNPIRREAV